MPPAFLDSGQAGPFVETASESNDVAANVIFFPNRQRTLARALPQRQPPECRANLGNSELRTGMPVPRDTIVELYRYILGREPESAAVVDSKAEHFASVEEARLATLRCEEFADQLTNLGIVPAGQLTEDTIEDWIDYSDLFAFHGYAEEELQLFSQFDTSRVIATPGFLTDWIGSRVRLSSLWRSAAREGADRSVLPLPIPCDYHAATIEWIGILKAVLASVRSFSAIELGAGHGPWLAASSAAARALGIDELHLRGVEADPGRFALLQQNMDDNQLSTADTILYNAAIGAKGGRARWPRLDNPIEESGVRSFETAMKKIVRI